MRAFMLAAAAWAITVCAASAQTEATSAPLDRARAEAFMSGAVRQAMRDDRIVGASAAVIDARGVVMTRGYGRAGAAHAVDADTLFRVGSISKTFTWIALMQMVDAGALTLDSPVNEHLPEALRVPDDGFEAPILVRHLMAHNAGFEDSALGHLFIDRPERVLNLAEYLARYRVRRVRPPGELSVYSNYGAALAGAIVEHESGMDWPSYAEARILRPLGMARATYREPYTPEIARANRLPEPAPGDVAAQISQGFRAQAGQMEAASFEYITQIGPAGGLSASANDMARYLQALLDPARLVSTGVLSEASARALAEPIFANDERLGAWRHGFMTIDLGAGRSAFGHGGDTIYQHSEMLVSRDLGMGIFVTINTAAPHARAPASIAEAFIAEFYPPPPPTRAATTQAESQRFAGAYQGLRRPYFRTERALFRLFSGGDIAAAENGDLIASSGLGSQRFIPIGDGVYQEVDGVERIAFREIGGRMHLLDAYGLSPSERVGFFETAAWLSIIIGLALLVAGWGVLAGMRRLFMRRENLAALVFDLLCLVWLVALATLFAAMAPWLAPDQGVVVFGYPGPLFPAACWLLAGAAAATAMAMPLALTVARDKDWSWARWVRAGACFLVFAALSTTLWDWGFLGFSDF